MDPFFGFLQHPGSLHKYLYGNGDPTEFHDPSGLFGIGGFGGFAVANVGVIAVPRPRFVLPNIRVPRPVIPPGLIALPGILAPALPIAGTAMMWVAIIGTGLIAYGLLDHYIFDALRERSLLIHVRDNSLMSVAAAINGGNLRVLGKTPPMYFTPLFPTPVDFMLNNLVHQAPRIAAIKSGLADGTTQAAIDQFIRDVGLPLAQTKKAFPLVTSPSRKVAVVHSVSTKSPWTPNYAGGLSVRWEQSNPFARLFVKSMITNPGELVPWVKIGTWVF